MLLVEAGPAKRPMNVRIPAAFPTQSKTKADWEVYTEPEPHLDGRVIYHPRAKVLGGCSAMNAMIYIRGNRADYDAWARDGATGWSYDEVLPLFKRAERNSRGAGHYHGVDGPLYIEDARNPNPFSETILDAMAASGLPRHRDFNAAEQEGVGFYQVTHRKGMRWTTADGYVRPAMRRPNFPVLSETRVMKVRISDGRADGIEVERRGRRDGRRGRPRAGRPRRRGAARGRHLRVPDDCLPGFCVGAPGLI